MIERIMILLLMASMLFLCSCSLVDSRIKMLYKESDEAKADARLEQIIEAVKNKDKDSLRAMFSKQALDEAEDLDGRMDYLFDFVKGKIKSWEKIVHGATVESIDHGSRTKGSSSWYYVNTDKEKYLFFFKERTIDTDHPEKVGVYMIQVIKAEDRETQFDGGGSKTGCAGIYKPKE